ncbi:MAG: DUF805 domain-containing protein [Acetobacteraceae bacterium]|nr:DUF805 domain-containing protein [Acetobacteraceae bacterium]
MDFSTAVRTCLQKYVTFDGRASRPEYWWFVLFGFLVVVVLMVVGMVIGFWLLALLYLALLPPGIAAGARRLHDTGRSGWWLLAPTVPNVLSSAVGAESLLGILLGLVGLGLSILLIWWLASPGDPQPNAFGPPPA